MADRIEAGTFLIAAAMCGGEIEAQGISSEFISSLLHKLRENGCKIYSKNDKIILKRLGGLVSVKSIETQPYPGFPTDLQAQMTALCCICRGQSIITENLFETRFKYVPELRKMGADITVAGRETPLCAERKIQRRNRGCLRSARRSGSRACGACRRGQERGVRYLHTDRGYGMFEYKLRSLGADIVRAAV